MDEAICITGPYETVVTDKLITLSLSPPGSELRITTPPGMGVVTYTRHILNVLNRPFVEINCVSMSFEDSMPLPVPDGQGGVQYIYPTFEDPYEFETGKLILVQDVTYRKWDQLTHIKAWVEAQQKLGSRVIIIFSGNA